MVSRTTLSLCCFCLAVLVCPSQTLADKLTITSNPPGATVELNGTVAGTTPFERDYPGGYFHKTRTSLGARLEHALVARLILPGYVTEEVKLTEGPMNWISLKGRNRGEYWLLKSDHFHVDLEPISNTFPGALTANLAATSDGASSSEASLTTPPTAVEGSGTVSITSEPDGAEIFVDDKFHGNTPAALRLTAGSHRIVLKFPKHADWHRTLEVLKSSRTSLKASLDLAP